MSGASRVSQQITGNSLQLTNDKQFYSTIFRARLSLRETTLFNLWVFLCWWANNKTVKWKKDNQCYLDTYLWKDQATDVDFLSQQGSQMNHWWFTSEVNESSRNLHSGRQTPWEWVRLCMRYTHAGRQLQTNFAKIMSQVLQVPKQTSLSKEYQNKIKHLSCSDLYQ